jgi:hypothetical protein
MRVAWRLAVAATAAFAVAVIGAMTVADYRSNRAVMVLHSAMANATDTGEVSLLKRLAAGGRGGVSDLAKAIAFAAGGNDCSDFRLITLLRALYAHEAQLPPVARTSLLKLFTGVRYWMDEPGDNAMVYWSENHQILFAASEYLAGQRYPDAMFADRRSGAAHRDAARARILFWLEQRWRFGFSEWNSHYYAEDIAPLANLIDFARDGEIRRKATIVLDLLLFDVASQSLHGEFVAASGRLYENNKKFGDASIRRVIRHAFDGVTGEAEGIEINFLQSSYRTPPVLAAIAHDGGDVAIRASAGRDLAELGDDESLSTEDRRIMAQWGMEAFSNPRAIAPTLAYVREHALFDNPYFAALRPLNYRVLQVPGVLPAVSWLLDIPVNGVALQRANTYTYRTRDYAMSTTIDYQPGSFGNQQHVFNLTLDPGMTLFLTHPAVWPRDPPPNGNAPGYWTGSGRLPLSC